MTEDDHRAVIRVELENGLVKVPPLFELLGLLGRVRAGMLEGLVELLVRTARLQPVDRLVHGHAVDPAEKLAVAVIARQMLVRLHERLLADLPRILGIADHVQHGVEHRPLVSHDQLAERVRVTLQAALNRNPVQIFLLHQIQLVC